MPPCSEPGARFHCGRPEQCHREEQATSLQVSCAWRNDQSQEHPEYPPEREHLDSGGCNSHECSIETKLAGCRDKVGQEGHRHVEKVHCCGRGSISQQAGQHEKLFAMLNSSKDCACQNACVHHRFEAQSDDPGVHACPGPGSCRCAMA